MWFISVFVLSMAFIVCSNVLAYVYRKPGVTMSVFINGYDDEPAPSGFFQMSRVLKLIRDDKVSLVYWTGFAGAFLFMADVLAVFVMAYAIDPR